MVIIIPQHDRRHSSQSRRVNHGNGLFKQVIYGSIGEPGNLETCLPGQVSVAEPSCQESPLDSIGDLSAPSNGRGRMVVAMPSVLLIVASPSPWNSRFSGRQRICSLTAEHSLAGSRVASDKVRLPI